MIFEFELEGLPKTTNSNMGHWTAKAAEARKWKRAVADKCFNHPFKIPLKTAKLTLIRYSSVSPDYDGLVSSFKHVIDSLIDSKVIENDKFDNIGAPTYRWEKTSKGQGKISVKVEGE